MPGRKGKVLSLSLLSGIFLAVFVLSSAGEAQNRPDSVSTVEQLHPALQYRVIFRRQPRPLRIHVLRVDLRGGALGMQTVAGEDPDGRGPAEASLEDPLKLAAGASPLAAVNANFFAWLPRHEPFPGGAWQRGTGMDILGWAVSSGRSISPPQRGYVSLWSDPQGKVHLAKPSGSSAAREAISGYPTLLLDGRLRPAPGGALHPRTAVGLDVAGRWLVLVVVDGRQEGYSEGVTFRELAALMQELGCREAVNLDGGGSSVMLLQRKKQPLRIVNQPAGGVPRPVPLMLTIRDAKP